MIVVSVKFKGRGKTYFFDPNGQEVPAGVQVVVETSKGMELADCVQGNHEVLDDRIVPPLRPVVRVATPDGLRIAALCKEREKDAFRIAEKKIAEHGLDMKLVDVECNFEGSKILFFFTSDGRVDFRELVKDLAGVFRTRIELRQIGVRDEAKMLGGLGICGRPFCCHQFLDDFEPVSTKMAKTQSLSLNPAKISGSCGRLMCCLRYEQEAYEELVKSVPKNGAFVETPSGYGNVAQVNLLRQTVKVKLDGEDNSLHSFDADEVASVPGGRPKPGEPLPHVLKAPVKKKEEPEEPEKTWTMPPIFAEDTIHEDGAKQTEQAAAEEKKSTGSSRRHRSRGKKPGQSGEEKKPEQSAQPKPKQEKPKTERPAKPEQPKDGGEAPKVTEDGEKKHSSSHRSRHHRGGEKKPGSGEANGTSGEGSSGKTPAAAQPKGEKQGQRKPHTEKSGGERTAKPEGGPAKSEQPKNGGGEQTKGTEGGGEKKSGSRNHRYYHHKPKAKPNGGEGQKNG